MVEVLEEIAVDRTSEGGLKMDKKLENLIERIAAMPCGVSDPSLEQLAQNTKERMVSLSLVLQMGEQALSEKAAELKQILVVTKSSIDRIRASGVSLAVIKTVASIHKTMSSILSGGEPFLEPAQILERALDASGASPKGSRNKSQRNTGKSGSGQAIADAPKNYGLSSTTPVFVPGGTEEGAGNEKRYLFRLRCPKGKPVEFTRRGSVNPMVVAMSEANDQSREAMMAELNEALQKFGPGGMPAKYRSVDVYDVKCTCGEHEATVYINMYEAGPDEPIGLPCWALTDQSAVMKAAGEAGATQIHIAAQDGSVRRVRYLIGKDPDLAAALDDDKETPLHYAATNGHRAVAELLLEKGSDVNAAAGRFTPLMLAVANGHKGVAELLLTQGAEVGTQEKKNGQAALCIAAAAGHADIARLLLDKGADVNARSRTQQTALMVAVIKGHKDVMDLLLSRGSDINAQDNEGNTPLLFAMGVGPKEMVEPLLAAGADVNLLYKEEKSALILALYGGYEDLAAMFLEHGANVNVRMKDTRATPLFLAAARGNEKLVQMTLAKKPELDAKDSRGRTPLHIAAEHGYGKVANLLLDAGADIESKNMGKQTPLYVAVKNGKKDITSLILDKEANVNPKDCEDQTPLLVAVAKGHTDIVELLLSKGADPNIIDVSGQHSLLLAIENGNENTAQALLDKGAAVNTKGPDGQTALHIAASKGQSDIVAALLQASADPKARDEDGRKPRTLAKIKRHNETAKLIRKHERSWWKFW